MIYVKVRFGIDIADSETVLEFEDGTDPQEMEDAASDYARERFWWSHEIVEQKS